MSVRSLRASKRRPRGFLLLEALVAGVLLSVTIVSVFHMLGSADRMLTSAARRAQANAALADGLTSHGSLPFANVTPGVKENWLNVAGAAPGKVKRHIRVADDAAGPCTGCRKVSVQVRYDDANGTVKRIAGFAWVAP